MICQNSFQLSFVLKYNLSILFLGTVDAEIVAKKEVRTFDISNVLLRLNASNMSTL